MGNKEERLNDIVEVLEALEALSKLKKIEEKLKDAEESKAEAPEINEEEREAIDKAFSKDCELHVHVSTDEEEDETRSKCEVSFTGCKGIQDAMILGVAAMSSIIEGLPKRKAVDVLSTICTLALAGERAGVFKAEEE